MDIKKNKQSLSHAGNRERLFNSFAQKQKMKTRPLTIYL